MDSLLDCERIVFSILPHTMLPDSPSKKSKDRNAEMDLVQAERPLKKPLRHGNDKDGKKVIIDSRQNDEDMASAQISALLKSMPRRITVTRTFIRRLSKQLISNTDTSKLVISGDWNTILNPINKRGGQPWKGTNYINSLINLMEELNLIDIYRRIRPTTKSFTYESKTLNVKSRIDFSLFLVLCLAASRVQKFEHQ